MFRKRTRALSVTSRFQKFYHVTLESNLLNIQFQGLDPSFGGSDGGISHLKGGDYQLRSENKIHFTSEWAIAKRYADHFATLLEKNPEPSDFPVILELNLLENYYDQHLDPDEEGCCYYTHTPIKPNSISILVSPYPHSPNGEENYTSANQHQWLPIQKWNSQQFLPTYLDKLSLIRQHSGGEVLHDAKKTRLSDQFFYTPIINDNNKRTSAALQDLSVTASPSKKLRT